ncbi:MAG: molybdopterin-dependent oxidoreductase, partial [Acidobacteria bacterium]|nr:molybdopterin-dependent oxidoreductase [Acidobacteriota bacterium]
WWQNGKLHIHSGTQSAVQTVASISRWMNIPASDVVLITEYTGGGFGARATGSVHSMIPALLAKKTNAPVMMRITREEEQYIGGIRPAVHGRVKAGFAKDGKLLALDLFLVGENSAYEAQADANSGGRFVSLLYQPQAMRSRGITVLTNTPPRRAQSQPGGLQAIMVVEPVMAKAARQLGIDQVALRRINAPEGKAKIGPADAKGERAYATSAFLKEALDRGKEAFRWDERKARSGKRNGSTVRGVGVAVSTFVAGSTGFDGLFVIKPDGRMYVQSGVGNLGTESVFDVHRVAADLLGMPWDKVTVSWGDTAQPLPWTCVSGGSQTTHAMTRAAHAAASDAIAKAKEIAAKALGGSPESYQVAGERVFSGGRSMTLADVARRAIEMAGKYDGHELPENINAVTKTAAAAMAGQGLMGVARDTYPRDGGSYSFVAGFAEVEVDVETGHYQVLDYTAIGDSGTIIHPRAYGGQLLGRSVLGMSHALSLKTVYDQHYGLSMTQRFYQSRPPTLLDVPRNMQWEALNIPDPETPVGARGIGEPPVAAGACAILNALSDALGDDVYRRAPVTMDTILMALEHGRPMQDGLTAHI